MINDDRIYDYSAQIAQLYRQVIRGDCDKAKYESDKVKIIAQRMRKFKQVVVGISVTYKEGHV